jgi:S1-C subfamily serine protease
MSQTHDPFASQYPSYPTPPTPRPRRLGAALLAIGVCMALLIGVGLGWLLQSNRPGGGVGTSSANLSLTALEAKVDPALVDVVSTLGDQNGEAAGTGIVLTASGEVLTNNHVIEGATSVKVTDVGNGQTYTASVVGYDATDDVAVLQLHGASGLKTASLGDSSRVAVGQAVVALGNAGGVGGTPSVSSGTVTALDQAITASDEGSGSSEQLTGLIETNATLQAGDSGGSLVDMHGNVVGMDTAASSGFQFQGSGSQNYAIPINKALAIAAQIEAGHGTNSIHIGSTAFLGVGVTASTQVAGAVVTGVLNGSPAASAGLSAGDVITGLGGQTVDSPSALSAALVQHRPGDHVSVTWTDQSGQSHTATVTLANGPAA